MSDLISAFTHMINALDGLGLSQEQAAYVRSLGRALVQRTVDAIYEPPSQNLIDVYVPIDFTRHGSHLANLKEILSVAEAHADDPTLLTSLHLLIAELWKHFNDPRWQTSVGLLRPGTSKIWGDWLAQLQTPHAEKRGHEIATLVNHLLDTLENNGEHYNRVSSSLVVDDGTTLSLDIVDEGQSWEQADSDAIILAVFANPFIRKNYPHLTKLQINYLASGIQAEMTLAPTALALAFDPNRDKVFLNGTEGPYYDHHYDLLTKLNAATAVGPQLSQHFFDAYAVEATINGARLVVDTSAFPFRDPNNALLPHWLTILFNKADLRFHFPLLREVYIRHTKSQEVLFQWHYQPLIEIVDKPEGPSGVIKRANLVLNLDDAPTLTNTVAELVRYHMEWEITDPDTGKSRLRPIQSEEVVVSKNYDQNGNPFYAIILNPAKGSSPLRLVSDEMGREVYTLQDRCILHPSAKSWQALAAHPHNPFAEALAFFIKDRDGTNRLARFFGREIIPIEEAGSFYPTALYREYGMDPETGQKQDDFFPLLRTRLDVLAKDLMDLELAFTTQHTDKTKPISKRAGGMGLHVTYGEPADQLTLHFATDDLLAIIKSNLERQLPIHGREQAPILRTLETIIDRAFRYLPHLKNGIALYELNRTKGEETPQLFFTLVEGIYKLDLARTFNLRMDREKLTVIKGDVKTSGPADSTVTTVDEKTYTAADITRLLSALQSPTDSAAHKAYDLLFANLAEFIAAGIFTADHLQQALGQVAVGWTNYFLVNAYAILKAKGIDVTGYDAVYLREVLGNKGRAKRIALSFYVQNAKVLHNEKRIPKQIYDDVIATIRGGEVDLIIEFTRLCPIFLAAGWITQEDLRAIVGSLKADDQNTVFTTLGFLFGVSQLQMLSAHSYLTSKDMEQLVHLACSDNQHNARMAKMVLTQHALTFKAFGLSSPFVDDLWRNETHSAQTPATFLMDWLQQSPENMGVTKTEIVAHDSGNQTGILWIEDSASLPIYALLQKLGDQKLARALPGLHAIEVRRHGDNQPLLRLRGEIMRPGSEAYTSFHPLTTPARATTNTESRREFVPNFFDYGTLQYVVQQEARQHLQWVNALGNTANIDPNQITTVWDRNTDEVHIAIKKPDTSSDWHLRENWGTPFAEFFASLLVTASHRPIRGLHFYSHDYDAWQSFRAELDTTDGPQSLTMATVKRYAADLLWDWGLKAIKAVSQHQLVYQPWADNLAPEQRDHFRHTRFVQVGEVVAGTQSGFIRKVKPIPYAKSLPSTAGEEKLFMVRVARLLDAINQDLRTQGGQTITHAPYIIHLATNGLEYVNTGALENLVNHAFGALRLNGRGIEIRDETQNQPLVFVQRMGRYYLEPKIATVTTSPASNTGRGPGFRIRPIPSFKPKIRIRKISDQVDTNNQGMLATSPLIANAVEEKPALPADGMIRNTPAHGAEKISDLPDDGTIFIPAEEDTSHLLTGSLRASSACTRSARVLVRAL